MGIQNATRLFFLLIITAFSACSQTNPIEPAGVNLVSPEAFQKAIETTQSKIILDVRTPAEYKKGHLPDAVLIDIFRDDFVQAIQQLDTTKTIFVYCGIGGRSEEASDILKQNGFKLIYDLDGGIAAWKQKQLPVTSPQ